MVVFHYTTSIHTGVRGGGKPQSGANTVDIKLKMVQIEVVLSCTHHNMYIAKSMKNITSQSCDNFQLASASPSKMESFEDHPSTDGHLPGLRKQPE